MPVSVNVTGATAYIEYDPFDGDRDIDIECRMVRLVVTKAIHECTGIPGLSDRHDIPVGSTVRRESAKVEGRFGTCYTCLPCMDRFIAWWENDGSEP